MTARRVFVILSCGHWVEDVLEPATFPGGGDPMECERCPRTPRTVFVVGTR